MPGEIIAIGGLPGSGKTSHVQPYLDRGYTRVNRDTTGGKMDSDQTPFWQEVRRLYGTGVRKFVFDNTWCFKSQRDVLLAVAAELGLPVHLKMLDVDIAKAQLFTARREVQKYGRLLHKDDYKGIKDINTFGPGLHFRFQKELDAHKPTTADGFASVEWLDVPVVWGPEYVNRAIILDLDGTVRDTPADCKIPFPKHPDEVIVLDGRRELLRRKQAEGFILCGASNQSGVSKPLIDPKTGQPDPWALTKEQVEACIAATCDKLGLDIDVLYAPDRGGPPQSFWRKPCPGMGVEFIEKYKLDPSQCVMVGDMKTDKTFAERCGFQFAWAHEFFRG
jgi:HAD superfamily hydrolase (TIGR01662 family)